MSKGMMVFAIMTAALVVILFGGMAVVIVSSTGEYEELVLQPLSEETSSKAKKESIETLKFIKKVAALSKKHGFKVSIKEAPAQPQPKPYNCSNPPHSFPHKPHTASKHTTFAWGVKACGKKYLWRSIEGWKEIKH